MKDDNPTCDVRAIVADKLALAIAARDKAEAAYDSTVAAGGRLPDGFWKARHAARRRVRALTMIAIMLEPPTHG